MQSDMQSAAKVSTMSNQIQVLRDQLDGLFSKYRGSRKAFCEQERITPQTLRLLMAGKISNNDRLTRASEFIEDWSKRTEAEKKAQEKELIANLQHVIGNMASDEAPELN